MDDTKNFRERLSRRLKAAAGGPDAGSAPYREEKLDNVLEQ